MRTCFKIDFNPLMQLKRVYFFLGFLMLFINGLDQLIAQEIAIPIRSRFSLEENARINFGPDIGWAAIASQSTAPPPPPPGAFDVRVINDGFPLFRDIRVYEDSTWYKWDVVVSPLGTIDTTYFFFDRCELLNNVREAYIVNRDSSVVFDMVSDSIAVISEDFRTGGSYRFTAWLLSKPTTSDDPPIILANLPNAVLDPNTEIPYRINVSSFFQSASGAPLRFSAETDTRLVNLVSTPSGIVELTLKEGVEDTSITVTVTAFGAGCGFVEQEFVVDIPAIINLPVELQQSIPDFSLAGDFPTRVLIPDLNEYFVDPNETQPVFAVSFNASLVNVFLSGNALLATSIAGVFNTSATVIITASDGEFSVSDDFLINIGEPNRVPFRTQGLAPIELEPNFGFIEAVYLRNYYSDPDGDQIIYTLDYDFSKINAGVQGDTLFLASIDGVKNERIQFNLTVSDGLLSFNDTFEVIIKDDLPPVVSQQSSSLTLESGFSRFEWIRLNQLFSDPENKELRYQIRASEEGVATFTIENNQVIINEIEGVFDRSTDVIIEASDAFQTVSATYQLTIDRRNRAPQLSSESVQISENFLADLSIPLDLKEYFTDPDGDSLTFRLEVSSNITVVENGVEQEQESTNKLEIILDQDSAIVSFNPTFNDRIDETILIIGSDGEFEKTLTVELDIYPIGVVIPDPNTPNNNNSQNKNLYRTYPNPAQVNNQVTIVYELNENETGLPELTEVSVYNIMGRLIKTLVLKELDPGVYSVTFNTQGLAAGTYIYTMRTSTGIISRKLTLID